MAAPEIRFEALGKAWRFKFGFTALCALEEQFKQPTSAIMVRYFPSLLDSVLSEAEVAKLKLRTRLADLRELMIAALSEHHPEITRALVADIVDDIGIDAAGALLLRALRASQGGSEGTARPPEGGEGHPAA